MIKKNSMFTRLLILIIGIMLIQSVLIGTVLFANGTIQSLESSAVDTLRKNTENRTITLENMMVRNWSNVDQLEQWVLAYLENYLTDQGVSLEDAMADSGRLKEILTQASIPAINALRRTSTNGVFLYFYAEDVNVDLAQCRGVYYRDLDPIASPADYSDLLYLRGPVDIARKDNIPLDSLWTETFSFSPSDGAQWKGFHDPLQAAADFPDLHSADLSYWNWSYNVASTSPNNTNICLTYTRPLIFDGKPIGIVGTELQSKYLSTFFPAEDFGSSGQGGYLLLSYDTDQKNQPEFLCQIHEITGSYINRMFAKRSDLTLRAVNEKHVYNLADANEEGVQVVLQPLKLYNTNAPFSGEEWALAAIGTDKMLFAASRKVQVGVVYSSIGAFFLSTILMTFAIRRFTAPLAQIVRQIEYNAPDDPIAFPKQNAHEIVTLCNTLNDMKRRRKKMNIALQEERERYLVALENATDTFMEYDLETDSLMLYYFLQDGSDSPLQSQVIPQFSSAVRKLEFCPRGDIAGVRSLRDERASQPIEMRIKASFFPHIIGVEPDEGYYWFAIKSKCINDELGNVKKIIGNARQITAEKKKEIAQLEAARRDVTTGLYNREYGLLLIDQRIQEASAGGIPFCLFYIRAERLDLLEAHYGRMFAGIIMRDFGRELLQLYPQEAVPVRLWNDDFLVFVPDTDGRKLPSIVARFSQRLDAVYMGEKPELRLAVSAGTASFLDSSDGTALRQKANLAMLHASQNGAPACYASLTDLEKCGFPQESRRRVSTELAISRETVVGVTFDVLEHTTDMRSALNALLRVLGDLFCLDRVLVCSYDSDFGANLISYYWCSGVNPVCFDKVDRISPNDVQALDEMLAGGSTLLYTSEIQGGPAEGLGKLLCIVPGQTLSAFCCATYENGIQTGRVLYQSSDPNYEWNEEVTYSLQEVAKIVAAHVSIEKSNNASKAKSEFLSRVSHEIRTPMNAIIGMTGIAKDSLGDLERMDDCLKKIDFSAKHLLSIINDVLEMSRIESGKMEMVSEPFSLRGFVESVDTLMRPSIEFKRVAFTIEQRIFNDRVLGDANRLRQVLVNLIGNAQKFTDAGGEIVFSLEEQEDPENGSAYRFSVRDTGFGISPEEQYKVFGAFEQAKMGAKQQGGTGLGLAISRSIVSAMSSTIYLESELGKGSEFFFTLHLAPADEAATSDELQELAETDFSRSLQGKKALLVEDNAINMEIAKYVLEDVGMVISTALNGQEAVDLFLQSACEEYDVVLMDIQMPVMDGLTATREIRKNTQRPDARLIPIVAMTANAFDEDMRIAIDSGMNGYIAKPIDNLKLYELLASLLCAESADE